MVAFGRGNVWPDSAGTPTDPTAAYVTGDAFEVREENELACRVIISGADCRAVQIEAQVSTDGQTTYRTVERKTLIGTDIGTHQTSFRLPHPCWARLRARRYGGTANTLLVVAADARWSLGDRVLDGQPLELAPHQVAGVECWGSGAGAAAAMAAGPAAHVPAPAAAAAQQWYPTGEADTAVIDFTVAVAAPTTVELEIRERPDGTNAVEQVAVNSVIAGAVNQQIAEEQLVFGALDTRRTREIPVRPGTEILVLGQYTGGGGGTTGYGLLRLYKMGRM